MCAYTHLACSRGEDHPVTSSFALYFFDTHILTWTLIQLEGVVSKPQGSSLASVYLALGLQVYTRFPGFLCLLSGWNSDPRAYAASALTTDPILSCFIQGLDANRQLLPFSGALLEFRASQRPWLSSFSPGTRTQLHRVPSSLQTSPLRSDFLSLSELAFV